MRADPQPGRWLGTKATLGAEFDVAPATLAEALRLLRERGVVEVRPGPRGGVFAAHPSPMYELARQVIDLRQQPQTVSQVVEVLNALDDAVCSDALRARTKQDLKDLEGLADQLEQSWDRSAQTMQRNWALHRRIAEISPNAVLRAFYLNLVDYVEAEGFDLDPTAPLGSSSFDPFDIDRAAVHRNLVTAIRTQDRDVLIRALAAHRGA